MNKGLKITLYIAGGLALATGIGFAISSALASKDKKDEEAKKKADEAIANAIKNNAIKVDTPHTTNPNEQPVVTNLKPEIKGIVSDAVLKYGDSPLIGKKVYAVLDNLTAFNTAGKVYTKTKKGQLMGTYAYSKTKVTGGKNIYIKTTDAANRYIYMGATLLTF